ncbi:Hypothetical predicted protein [Olea europaea subsp. europaea]|uniref:Uncharacterized protein n=1 Tax=Olea europaea subsp. europaea TaxID=158383 RepID=A0A8S0QG45_OLEEU|nr:Hypothetical predicted protein [Olea europaea subsp. europaea]
MEVFGKSMVAATNVIYLSSILGQDGPNSVHKCDWKCENECICGNMFRCRLTGLTHFCDKNCNQRILYDNHSSLCRVSKQIFPLTPAEQHAVKGIRRKLEAESPPVRAALLSGEGMHSITPYHLRNHSLLLVPSAVKLARAWT